MHSQALFIIDLFIKNPVIIWWDGYSRDLYILGDQVKDFKNSINNIRLPFNRIHSEINNVKILSMMEWS